MNKQYLMIVDEIGMSLLSATLKNISFIPVMGMDLNERPDINVLITPKPTVEVTPPVTDEIPQDQ